jgi:hypothetical protein
MSAIRSSSDKENKLVGTTCSSSLHHRDGRQIGFQHIIGHVMRCIEVMISAYIQNDCIL